MKAVEKDQVRSRILNQIKSLDTEQKNQKSRTIESRLKILLHNQDGYWAGYQNLSDEPVIAWGDISANINWCFPVVQEKVLKFKTLNKTMTASALGVREPVDGNEISLDEIKGVVIPAIAFDKKGFRLGRGKGFYDRTLAHYRGKKVGVCYEVSLCEKLPHEAHDICCDRIVTENLIYQTGSSEGDSKWS